MPQGFGLFEALLDALFDLIADGETGFDFGDDGVLLLVEAQLVSGKILIELYVDLFGALLLHGFHQLAVDAFLVCRNIIKKGVSDLVYVILSNGGGLDSF